jgi:hypothetical protein
MTVGALELAKTFAGPVAAIIAALTAAIITWVFNSRQLKIAEGQLLIAETQKKIAAARLSFDLYEKRFAIFEGAKRLLLKAVQDADIDARQVITFKVETVEAVFLFDQDIVNYLETLLNKVLRFQRLRTQEKAADEYGEEAKRLKLVDLVASQHQELVAELALIVEKFKPYFKFDDVRNAKVTV